MKARFKRLVHGDDHHWIIQKTKVEQSYEQWLKKEDKASFDVFQQAVLNADAYLKDKENKTGKKTSIDRRDFIATYKSKVETAAQSFLSLPELCSVLWPEAKPAKTATVADVKDEKSAEPTAMPQFSILLTDPQQKTTVIGGGAQVAVVPDSKEKQSAAPAKSRRAFFICGGNKKSKDETPVAKKTEAPRPN